MFISVEQAEAISFIMTKVEVTKDIQISRTHFKQGIFQKEHIPKRANSKKSTFKKGSNPKKSTS